MAQTFNYSNLLNATISTGWREPKPIVKIAEVKMVGDLAVPVYRTVGYEEPTKRTGKFLRQQIKPQPTTQSYRARLVTAPISR